MQKVKISAPKSAPRKARAAKRAVAKRTPRRSSRSDQAWFFHPAVQAGVAEAEADFLNGRSFKTDSVESLQKLLDSWK